MSEFNSDLSTTVLNQDDPVLVAQGLPSYLLIIDTLITREPHDVKLLKGGADAYNAYVSGFVEDNDRRIRLSDKAMNYAERMICEFKHRYCDIRNMTVADATRELSQFSLQEIPTLYTFASVWATWIQAHASNWDAIAQLAYVESIMSRVVALNEKHEHAGAHLYLGTLAMLVPPAMGGDPQRAKFHFDRAIELEQGQNLMAKVLCAEHYARAIYDREYHDRLLHEVLSVKPQKGALTLSNAIAQKKAEHLLATADSYF